MKKFIIALCCMFMGFCLVSCDFDKKDETKIEAPHIHTFSSEWSSDETYHYHQATCEHTDKVSDKAEHSFGEWKVANDATEDVEGKMIRECSICHYIEERIVETVVQTTNTVTSIEANQALTLNFPFQYDFDDEGYLEQVIFDGEVLQWKLDINTDGEYSYWAKQYDENTVRVYEYDKLAGKLEYGRLDGEGKFPFERFELAEGSTVIIEAIRRCFSDFYYDEETKTYKGPANYYWEKETNDAEVKFVNGKVSYIKFASSVLTFKYGDEIEILTNLPNFEEAVDYNKQTDDPVTPIVKEFNGEVAGHTFVFVDAYLKELKGTAPNYAKERVDSYKEHFADSHIEFLSNGTFILTVGSLRVEGFFSQNDSEITLLQLKMFEDGELMYEDEEGELVVASLYIQTATIDIFNGGGSIESGNDENTEKTSEWEYHLTYTLK